MFDLVKIFFRSHAHMRHVSPFEIQPIASVCVRIVEREKKAARFVHVMVQREKE